jgi:hypothetical protein
MNADTPTQSPTELARQAYQRGDHYFQIDLVVSVTEIIETQGTLRTRSYHPQQPPDPLGQIEEQGWTLQHVSTSYVLQDTSTVMFGVGEESRSADHGSLVALYVFRRTLAASASPNVT